MSFFSATAALLVGLGFAIRDTVGGAPFSAAASLLCGLLAAATLTFGFVVRKELFWELGAAACGALALAHVLFETPGFDAERQQFQLDVYAALVTPAVMDGNA
ncbi:hypothetical protein AWB77_00464 [Caballeronia fortuita]|uniref:Uncharacterized protein n=1 Tax=Caballeronia fortuita TaxID=1777138 RepID=A0A157ZAI6_9BURK|nr:hypothetical protein [Caballeronia fortuita]SAK42541.1 hypothetical protein AWB77_00464 [Caballeronia fortuita]